MATNYGTDFLWSLEDSDIDPNFNELQGDDPQDGLRIIAQDIVARFITSNGTLYLGTEFNNDDDIKDFGYNVLNSLGSNADLGKLYVIQNQMNTEILKDERVLGSDVQLSYSFDTSVLTITATITPSQATSFTLVFELNTQTNILQLVNSNGV